MIIPFQVDSPIRLASSAFAQDEFEDGPLAPDDVIELHAHHVLAVGTEVFVHCVVHLPHQGACGHAAVGIEEFLELPTPSDLVEVPRDIALLVDESWVPRRLEPQMRNFRREQLQISEARHLLERWHKGRPITRTLKLLQQLRTESRTPELTSDVERLLELIVLKNFSRSVSAWERERIVDGLRRVIRHLGDREGGTQAG